MELFQICRDNKHRFGTETGELTMEECPYCKTEMHIGVDTAKWEKSFTAKLEKGIKNGLSRGKLIDSLPRLPWFAEAIADKANDPEQLKAHKEWTGEDDNELAGLFAENGISTYETWVDVAASIGRSLYAIERQLRIIIARKEFELDDILK